MKLKYVASRKELDPGHYPQTCVTLAYYISKVVQRFINDCFSPETRFINTSVLFEESHIISICVCDLIHVRVLSHQYYKENYFPMEDQTL